MGSIPDGMQKGAQVSLSLDHSSKLWYNPDRWNLLSLSCKACFVWVRIQECLEGGRGGRGGGGSLVLAKVQVPALVLARHTSVIPDVTPERKLLTAYVGHFHKATCVTRRMLEVEVKTKPIHNQSYPRPSMLQRTKLPQMRACSYKI